MRLKLPLAAAFVLASASGLAGPPKAPTGKWMLEFGAHQCLAIREYRAGGGAAYLGFKPSPTGKLMQILLIFEKNAAVEAKDASVTIQIDGAPPVQARSLSYGTEKGTRQVDINLPIEKFAPMRQAANFSIVSKEGVNENFALRSMPALMAEMDRCLMELQEIWNVGAVAQAGLQARAKGDLGAVFTSDDYPLDAYLDQEGGTVEFVTLVDETGKVADCMVTETSGVPVLDAQACALVRKRGHYTPAIGGDGKATKAAETSKVKWVMQRPERGGGTRIK